MSTSDAARNVGDQESGNTRIGPTGVSDCKVRSSHNAEQICYPDEVHAYSLLVYA